MRRTAPLAAAAVIALGLGALATTTPATAAGQDPGARALAALAEHPGAARAASGQEFAARSTLTDADGTTHVRVDRSYRGLPVLGGDLVVHRGPGGAWRGASQTLKAPLDLAVTPGISGARAEKRTLGLRQVSGNLARGEQARRADSRRLVVDATAGAPRLAWEVVTGGLQANGTPSRLATYLDARSGTVIRSEQQIVNVDGTGRTLYSGTVGLSVTGSGSSFSLKDPVRGGTYTTDMNGAEDSFLCTLLTIGCKNGTTFTSGTSTFGDGTTGNRASAAADAHYGSQATWDYFKNAHGRNGIWNNGTGSFNRVHYGKNYVNAFWDGKKMTYGDGDGVNYGPLTSLDVAAHEMTHGITENSANLTYSGESGGLNEATSDIFGAMVEFNASNASDPGDYLVGEQFDLKNHRGLRRMDQPSADGKSLDCWSSNAKNVDVHYSSGIGNHFFYLLAEGTGTKSFGGVQHSSTTCNGTTVTGVGREAAAKIWYRALTVYMTSSTTYAQARTATMNAARDLYGAGSAQQNAVAAAWSGVNVS